MLPLSRKRFKIIEKIKKDILLNFKCTLTSLNLYKNNLFNYIILI